MIKIKLNKKDFHPENYSKIALVKTYKNGSEDYKAVCVCPRCGGRGYITFSSVDNSRCWECRESGKVLALIHVGENVKKLLTEEEIAARVKKIGDENEAHWLELGYKPLDFVLAGWVRDAWFNAGSYYRIIKETEKAYLMGNVENLRESRCEIKYWIPKAGVKFNKEN